MRSSRLNATRVLLSLSLVALAVVTLPGSARAGISCERVDLTTGTCLVSAEVPDDPGVPAAQTVNGDEPEDSGEGSPCVFTQDGAEPYVVDCSAGDYSWSNALNCYFRAADPQPDASDPAWQGRDPADGGAIYECFQPIAESSWYLWLAEAPERSGVTGPSPRAVALMAIEQMNLSAIDIGIAPEPGPDSVGLVGMPVWMWASNPGPSTTGPITRSASAGGVTVTATAEVRDIEWSMGDGAVVACNGPGTPYASSNGNQPSPTCGHVYTRTSAREEQGRFTVTATSQWVVTWAGAGQTGTIVMDPLQRSVQIAIGEAQVLVTQ
jgi:hypothetical protein